MKPLLFAAATAAVVLAGAPAFTQSAPPQPADNGTPRNEMAGADQWFRIEDPRKNVGQCFDGRGVVAASRAADNALLVQSRGGAIFRMRLSDSCDGLTAAELAAATKLTVRSNGSQICAGIPATVKIETPAGARSCKVRMIRRLGGDEVAALSASGQR